MAKNCPNKNSDEWKALVEGLGEKEAYRVFIANGESVPTLPIIENLIGKRVTEAIYAAPEETSEENPDTITEKTVDELRPENKRLYRKLTDRIIGIRNVIGKRPSERATLEANILQHKQAQQDILEQDSIAGSMDFVEGRINKMEKRMGSTELTEGDLRVIGDEVAVWEMMVDEWTVPTDDERKTAWKSKGVQDRVQGFRGRLDIIKNKVLVSTKEVFNTNSSKILAVDRLTKDAMEKAVDVDAALAMTTNLGRLNNDIAKRTHMMLNDLPKRARNESYERIIKPMAEWKDKSKGKW